MQTSFRSLLLRYLLPVGLMCRPRGDMYLQRAMLLANMDALRRWMPHYVRVHSVLALALASAFAATLELGAPHGLMALAALAASAELVLVVVFGSTALAARIPTQRGH